MSAEPLGADYRPKVMKPRVLCRSLPMLALVLAGCASESVETADPGPLTVATPSGDVAYPSAEVPGELTLDKGCVALDGRPVLWPSGTAWDEDEQTVRLPDGGAVTIGQRIVGGGGVVPLNVAGNYGGDGIQSAIDKCGQELGSTDMALLSSVEAN